MQVNMSTLDSTLHGIATKSVSAVNTTREQYLDITVGGQLDLSLTNIWYLNSAFLVFFMQCGFALLEAGGIRAKNVKNILLKNVVNTCLGALLWWAVGNAFANSGCGQAGNGFIGASNFFSSNAVVTNSQLYWSQWIFGWVFAAVSVTIPSGALAERCCLRAYLLYSVLQTSFTYPVVVHWIWSQQGWLSPFRLNCAAGTSDVLLDRSSGLIDFAGSINVHITGGMAALTGAMALGPRLGRFTTSGHLIEMRPNNPTHMVLGTLILWFGWYGFNPGSTGCMYGCMFLASKIAVNTTISAAAGGMSVLLFESIIGYPSDIRGILNGILSGLVAITSACSVVESYAAFLIGVISAAVYISSANMLKHFHIDDPLDSSAVHLFNGMWGGICCGFFATKTNVEQSYAHPVDWGVFYGGSGYQLGVQLLGVLVVMAWSGCITGALWLTLRRLGWLRVPPKVEEQGLDHTQGIGTGVFSCFTWLQHRHGEPEEQFGTRV